MIRHQNNLKCVRIRLIGNQLFIIFTNYWQQKKTRIKFAVTY